MTESRGASERFHVAELSLLGIAMVWGLTFPMVQDAIGRLPTFTFLAYRFIPASLLVAVIFRKQLAALPPSGWRAGLGMGVFLTAGYAFQTLGLDRTTSSNAGFITGLFVVFTPIFGAILLGHRAGAIAWIAAIVSAFGLYLLSGSKGGLNTGDAMILITACSFAFHILVTDRAVKDHDPGALLAVQLGVCGLVSLLIAGCGGDIEMPDAGQVWLALAVTAFVASALGFFVQTYAQRHAPPARTALILAAEPAFAGFFSWLLKDERLSASGWLGAALILGAIVAVEAMPYLRPTQPLPER
ncbi:MAG: EamA family transporter [Actinobacteria bacterium]|nr:EamA family transporter [Actinomycetota bacterium]